MPAPTGPRLKAGRTLDKWDSVDVSERGSAMTVLLLGDAERMPSWIGVGFKFMPMGRSAPSAIETTVGCVSGEAWPARRPGS